MPNPYFISILLYIFLAVLAALDSSLVSFQLLPWVNGLRWLRVHMVSLGILSQLIFALTPLLAARRQNQSQPKFRWDTWAFLNAGILALIYGISLINAPFILAGGTLIFAATIQLGLQLRSLKAPDPTKEASIDEHPNLGRNFYIAGLSFFGIGIIVGTGLWQGWPELLQMKAPIEVHIHANNFGFMSLVFAGLLVDLYPQITGRSFANPKAITPIFRMMTLGALGLVLGPWFGVRFLTIPGMLLFLTATIRLLLNVIKPLRGDKLARTPGIWHLTFSYLWLLAPISMAPFLLLNVPFIANSNIEANAPQALIYGWLLQFAIALLPWFFSRSLNPDQKEHKLGGSWWSFSFVNLGALALWANIFFDSQAAFLQGLAYLLWALSIIYLARQLWSRMPRELLKISI